MVVSLFTVTDQVYGKSLLKVPDRTALLGVFEMGTEGKLGKVCKGFSRLQSRLIHYSCKMCFTEFCKVNQKTL